MSKWSEDKVPVDGGTGSHPTEPLPWDNIVLDSTPPRPLQPRGAGPSHWNLRKSPLETGIPPGLSCSWELTQLPGTRHCSQLLVSMKS